VIKHIERLFDELLKIPLGQFLRILLAIGLGIVLISIVACQPSEPEPTVTPTAPPSRTATQEATIAAAQSATPTLPATLTRTQAPAAPPTPTSMPTQTPDPREVLPIGWQLLGNQLLGPQIAAPENWHDATFLLRGREGIGRFGQYLVFLTESQETANNLLAGNPPGGAFIFGFVGEQVGVEDKPEEILVELLAGAADGDSTAFSAENIVQPVSEIAFIDLPEEPLALFSIPGPPFMFRLLSFIEQDSDRPAILLMGSPANQWESNQELFEEMAKTISMPSPNNLRGHLASGDIVKGLIRRKTADIWTFNGEGGRYVTISLSPEQEGIDLTLKLLDSGGNVIASIDNGYDGDLEVLTDILLPDDGTYVIEAGEFFKEPGPYQLTLQLADEIQFGGGGRIEFAQEITTELGENSDHIWVFFGTAGQDISIILTSLDDQLDVILEVRGPDGSQITVLDEGFAGDAEVLTGLPLSVTGDYVIVVRGFAGRGGSYSLFLDEGGESTVNFYDAGDLFYGDRQREYLRNDEAHAWFFDGQAGDQVSIEVLPLEPNLDLDIWLLDPELNEVAIKDEFLSGESEKIEQILPNAGQYLVLVREFFGEPGPYEVALDASGVEVLEIAGSLTYSQTVQGTLPVGKQAGWTFTGQMGDVIHVLLTPDNSDHDFVIVLIDPKGETAVTVDSNLSGLPERLADYSLEISGEWLIVVREFFNEGSDYELTLSDQDF